MPGEQGTKTFTWFVEQVRFRDHTDVLTQRPRKDEQRSRRVGESAGQNGCAARDSDPEPARRVLLVGSW